MSSDELRPTVRVPRTLGFVGLCAAIWIANAVSAQQSTRLSQEEIARIQQEYQDQLRRSTLIGPDDDPTIELPNGDLIPVARENGCAPPQSRAGLILVDCTLLDSLAYYFDESTRAMVESCSFWFPDRKRCPPAQWPVDVPECDAEEVPASITGTWRLFAFPAANGFSRADGSRTITLADGTITFGLDGRAPVQRSYVVIEQDDQRYTLEISDERSAATRVDLELAPCGLFVESEGVCDAFCRNLADEVGRPTDEEIRHAAELFSGGRDDDELVEQIFQTLREAIEQGPSPVFLERAFYIREAAP